MSAVLEPRSASGNVPDMAVKLALSKRLQAVTNRIHSTQNNDEIILDVSRDICQLFEADRMTVYTLSEDGSSIVSKVKTGLNSFKDIKLPISESSMAGFCALNKRHMNIKDVYDDAELRAYSPNLSFLKAVDQRTGYRSKQMLLAPIMGGDSGTDLMGVIQLINSLSGQPFSALHDEGAAAADEIERDREADRSDELIDDGIGRIVRPLSPRRAIAIVERRRRDAIGTVDGTSRTRRDPNRARIRVRSSRDVSTRVSHRRDLARERLRTDEPDLFVRGEREHERCTRSRCGHACELDQRRDRSGIVDGAGAVRDRVVVRHHE